MPEHWLIMINDDDEPTNLLEEMADLRCVCGDENCAEWVNQMYRP